MFLTQAFKKYNVLAILFILCVCTAIWLFTVYSLDAKIALGGFTPIHYVHLKMLPNNFLLNFPSGIETYDQSLFMQIYKYAFQYINIKPEILIKIIIFLEIVGLFFLSFYLVRFITNHNNFLTSIAVSLLFTSSCARNLNLANTGTVVLAGQFYNFADIARVCGIILFFKNRKILAAFLMIIAVVTHTLLGIFAIVFCLSSVFFLFIAQKLQTTPMTKSPEKLFDSGNIIFIILTSVGLGIWYKFAFPASSSFAGQIDPNLWHALTQLGNYHWYPIDMGFLTFENWRYLTPFFAFLFLLIHYFPEHPSLTDKKILYGGVGIMLVSVLGLILSLTAVSPFLIKLSLHRSMDLIIIFGLIYVIHGLVEDIKKSAFLKAAFAISLLVWPFNSQYFPFYIVPVLMFLFPLMKNTLSFKNYNTKNILTLILISIVLIAFMFNYHDTLNFMLSHRYDGGSRFWELFILFVIILFIASLMLKKHFLKFKELLLILSITIGTFYYQGASLPSREYLKRAEDYLSAQLWAKSNTSKSSLFMIDPSICYGWREFSQRSSFGSLREWTHVSWLYNSSPVIFNEGMSRFALFDIPIETYFGYSPALDGFAKMTADIKEKFYQKDDNWFEALKSQYKINFLVLEKKYIIKPYKFRIAYENNTFIILEI